MEPKLTPEIINAAIAGFETQKRGIDAQIAQLRSMLDGASGPPKSTPAAHGRKKVSPEGRARIAEAQRLRWAKARGEAEPAAKPKRKLSPAGRRAIAEATRKRWAAVRAAKAKATKTAARKGASKKSTKRAASAESPAAASA